MQEKLKQVNGGFKYYRDMKHCFSYPAKKQQLYFILTWRGSELI